MKLNRIILLYRKEHNLSQRQFAQKCDVSNSYISMLENDINPNTGEPIIPSYSNLQKISHGMSMSVKELLEMLDPISIGDDAEVLFRPVHEKDKNNDSYYNYIGFLEDKADKGVPMTEFESKYYLQYINSADLVYPHCDTFKVLEKYFELDYHGKAVVDMILNEEYRRFTSSKAIETNVNYRSIPYSLLPASAGSGEWFEESDWGTIDIPDISEYSKADFAVRVHGESMTPDYEDGDIVLIHQQDAINKGDVGLFWVEDKGGVIKKMGRGELISINHKYDNIKYDTNIGRCFGKVIAKLDNE